MVEEKERIHLLLLLLLFPQFQAQEAPSMKERRFPLYRGCGGVSPPAILSCEGLSLAKLLAHASFLLSSASLLITPLSCPAFCQDHRWDGALVLEHRSPPQSS